MRAITLMVTVAVVSCMFLGAAVAQSSDKGSETKSGNDAKSGSDSKTEFDFSKGPGIEIGKELPDVTLENQDGEDVSIHELLKTSNVALVFYRSANW